MDVFSALADPTRRNIMELLAARGQLRAGDIYKQFSVSHPAISQHLQVLREAKLVTMEKHAQERLYELNPATMQELEGWVHELTERWNEQFNRLDELLELEKKKSKKRRK
jgi:DNA-binding transcriptional ArsR family regulator